LFRSAIFLLACALACAARAQVPQPPRPPDYGGLASYPVPKVQGGPAEFRTCVTYAKRAWRMVLMAEETQASLAQAKRWASERLGQEAAKAEIADYELLEKKTFKSPHEMAAARFIRCAHQLKLNPQMHHGGNAEHCWRVVAPLDIVARARAEDKSREQAAQVLRTARPGIQDETVTSILTLAFSGPSLKEGSGVIEDAFSECFSRAGGRQ
jgi:hypothetical protein